jgi:8-oxo-dGTP pyrophosphatase MutT (NUDIX family)
MTRYSLELWPDLPTRLAMRLQRPPPGRASQERLAPELCYGRHFGPTSFEARRAAVVMLLYPHEDRWMIPLTLRSAHLKTHAGQVSLPGGTLHADESPNEAARRELREELGVPESDVRMLGELSTIYLFVSDFVVTPCVGYIDRRPDFHPDPYEVAELIETPLSTLMDPTNLATQSRPVIRHLNRSPEYAAPYIAVGSHQVWGATAVLLGEFLAVVEQVTAATMSDQ